MSEIATVAHTPVEKTVICAILEIQIGRPQLWMVLIMYLFSRKRNTVCSSKKHSCHLYFVSEGEFLEAPSVDKAGDDLSCHELR